jgi:hypothetical protein
MSRTAVRTETLDLETISMIKSLCAEFGIMRSIYYEHSDLGAPGDGQISYMGLLAAMNGGAVSPEQDARIARSVAQVRSALRKAGRAPLAKELPALLKALLAAYEDDPEIFGRKELSILKYTIRRAGGRLPKK